MFLKCFKLVSRILEKKITLLNLPESWYGESSIYASGYNPKSTKVIVDPNVTAAHQAARHGPKLPVTVSSKSIGDILSSGFQKISNHSCLHTLS